MSTTLEATNPLNQPAPEEKRDSAQRGAIGTLELVNHIGMKLNLAISGPEEAYSIMRKYGSRGWISTELPPGGYRMPFKMAEVFDWSLIGAQPGQLKNSKGNMQDGVWYRNQFYFKRQPQNNENKGLGDMIKYSRGAKDTDDEQAIEEGDANFKFVTLITFKGNGTVNPAYVKPGATIPK